MTQCAACHSEMNKKFGTIELRVGGRLFFIKNISYTECNLCGEQTISPDVGQVLYERIKNRQYIEELIKVPVLDYAAA